MADTIQEIDPIIKGDHDELFGKNKNSIPYLLRLTHLLEQRGKDWFVDSDKNIAGNRLDKLSIGQELNKIISKKQSVLYAITKENARIEKILADSKQVLVDFSDKIKEREKVAIGIELIPLSKISDQLESIYELINDSKEIKVEENANSVIAFAEQTKSVINQKLLDNVEKSQLYSELDELIGLFDNNKDLLLIKLKENSDCLANLKKIKEYSANLQRNKEEDTNKLNVQINSLKFLNELKASILLLHTKQKEKKQVTKEITLLNQSLLEFQNNLKITNDNLENENKLIDQHKLINSELDKAQTEKLHIENLENLQRKWETDSVIIKKLTEETIPKIVEQKIFLEEVISGIYEELRLSNFSYEEKVKSLNSIKQGSDAIQEAVSVIATNLPKDRRDCPVCEADYEPLYLQERISNALNKINPLITDAVFHEKQALKKLEQIKKRLSSEKIKLEKLSMDLDKNNKLLNGLIISVEGNILPNFLNCKDANDAITFINDKKNTLKDRIGLLNKRKKDIKQKSDLDSINSTKLHKSELERKVEEIEKKINTVNGNLKDILVFVNDIQAKIGDSSMKKVNEDIKKIEESKNVIKESILKIEQEHSKSKTQITKIEEQILDVNEIISKLKSQQDGVQNKWINAGLDESPTKEKLANEKKQLLAENKELVDAKENLQKLDEELSRWSSAEKYKSLDNYIKEKIAPLNEQSYLEKLESEIKKNTKLFSNFKEKQFTLKDFFMNANNELTTIHDYIKSINPYWSALLKRVLINPRFSETDLLDSGTYMNKTFATTKAILHDEPFNVSAIASETQLTDLQLTFLLTMAKTYEWTPWKALLLDDPTQHHDLVHASSVFDLLRDYIVDLDFQVMISTHDSIQANFFQRKLQNDGIDAKIYRLKSRNSGIIAECSG